MLRSIILGGLRLIRTRLAVMGKKRFLRHGEHLHVGANVRLWAPHHLILGTNVYVGRDSHIECNATIGDHVMIANRVALVGRRDHLYQQIGVPVLFSTSVTDAGYPPDLLREEVVLEDDVWLGYGSIVLTGVRVGRGSIVAAGSVVTRDVPPYTIVGGAPARILGRRLAEQDIPHHEQAIREGHFVFSVRGRRHNIVRPGTADRP